MVGVGAVDTDDRISLPWQIMTCNEENGAIRLPTNCVTWFNNKKKHLWSFSDDKLYSSPGKLARCTFVTIRNHHGCIGEAGGVSFLFSASTKCNGILPVHNKRKALVLIPQSLI
jgi:hypothetical protein